MTRGRVVPGCDQKGYTIAVVLIFLMILTLFGTYAYRNTRTEITISKKTQHTMRVNCVAESAVNWALGELKRPRGDYVPYTKATHDPTGTTTLSDSVDGGVQGRKLKVSEVYALYSGTSVYANSSGWICDTTSSSALSISGLTPEKMCFKIWYPSSPVNAVRISAVGIAGTDSSQVEFIGTFNNAFIPD